MSDPALEEYTDEALVALVQEGGAPHAEAALELLLQRQYEGILRMAYVRTQNTDLSLDCTQEALLAISKSLKTFRGAAKFSTWAYAVARRSIWRTLKGQRKFDADSTSVDVGHRAEQAPAQQEERLLAAEEQRQILQAVSELPDKQQRAVLLYYYEDQSLEHIAKVIGCSASTVKAHLYKARASLEKKLLRSVQSSSREEESERTRSAS